MSIQTIRTPLGVLGAALGLAVAFHYLIAQKPFGIAFVLFVLLGIFGMNLISQLVGFKQNKWASLFLIPVSLSLIAELLYASDVVRALAFIISFLSLACYGYWISAPRQSFSQTVSFWPLSWIAETLFPFIGLSEMFAGRSYSKRICQIALGILVALPLILIFGLLFASADPFFYKSISQWLKLDRLFVSFANLMRDIIVGFYFLGFGWTMVRRMNNAQNLAPEKSWTVSSTWALNTFLSTLLALFALFIGFQAVYFFGGQTIIQTQGITYASYARQGFFQLLVVAGIVLGLSWILYRSSAWLRISTRILSTALLASTGVVITSAICRLILYIDAYGLTVSRWWAMAVMIIIAFALISTIVGFWTQIKYKNFAKIFSFSFVTIISALLLFNVEEFVARWNIDRYEKNTKLTLTDFDYSYIMRLSSDATIEMLRLQKLPIRKPVSFPNDFDWSASEQTTRRNWIQSLKDRAEILKEKKADWRNLVWSDYRAMNALKILK